MDFTKVDVSTSEPLPNTKIEIYTEYDELIFSDYTDEFGKIVIDNLYLGKYYILEKEAPAGYYLNPEKMWFEILENGDIVKCTMTDEMIVTVSNTGIYEVNMYVIASLSLIAIGVGVLVYACKRKKSK